MRVLIATFGSLGDLHPFLALGLELQHRGHDVALATSEYHRTRIAQAGLGFFPVAPDLRPDDRALIRATMDERGGPKAVFQLMSAALPQSYADCAAAADAFDPDVVLSAELAYAAAIMAEKRRLHWASATLSPLSFFSAYDHSIVPPAPWLGSFRRLGPGVYGMILGGIKRLATGFGRPINDFRAELGLAPVREPLFAAKHSPELSLAMFSKLMSGPHPDWPRSTIVTGYAFYDGGEMPLHPEIAAFLDAGDAPVVFTLGSAAVFDPGPFYEESVRAARMIGRRALLLVGPNPERVPATPSDVGVFDYAPFSRLFPRAAAVVHQGGSGTTGQAMRGGRPMVVVPYAHDQPDNAAHLRQLGIAVTVRRRAYTAAAAAAALRKVLADPAVARRAAEVSRIVESENGAAAAADAMERTFA